MVNVAPERTTGTSIHARMDRASIPCMDNDAGPTRSTRSEERSRRNRALGLRPRRSRHRLVLNRSEFLQLMADRGKTTPCDIAAYLELGNGTVYSAIEGRHVGDGFVSALMKKLRGGRRHVEEFVVPAVDVAA